MGEKCARLFDLKVPNVKPRFVQADEIWTYVQEKQKRMTTKDNPAERGDQYVWIALDSDSKAVLSYYVGKRDGISAHEFIGDLRQRVAVHHRCQITTDGLEGYVPAIEEHFGADVEFAQLVKLYTTPNTSGPDWFRPSRWSAQSQRRSLAIRSFHVSARRISSVRTSSSGCRCGVSRG